MASILEENEVGTLKLGCYHPSADRAMAYLRSLTEERLLAMKIAFQESADSGNEEFIVLNETLRRVIQSEPVSDRYLLGLSWAVRELNEDLGKYDD